MNDFNLPRPSKFLLRQLQRGLSISSGHDWMLVGLVDRRSGYIQPRISNGEGGWFSLGLWSLDYSGLTSAIDDLRESLSEE